MTPYKQGGIAYNENNTLVHNPYDIGTLDSIEWTKGFKKAMELFLAKIDSEDNNDKRYIFSNN